MHLKRCVEFVMRVSKTEPFEQFLGKSCSPGGARRIKPLHQSSRKRSGSLRAQPQAPAPGPKSAVSNGIPIRGFDPPAGTAEVRSTLCVRRWTTGRWANIGTGARSSWRFRAAISGRSLRRKQARQGIVSLHHRTKAHAPGVGRPATSIGIRFAHSSENRVSKAHFSRLLLESVKSL